MVERRVKQIWTMRAKNCNMLLVPRSPVSGDGGKLGRTCNLDPDLCFDLNILYDAVWFSYIFL